MTDSTDLTSKKTEPVVQDILEHLLDGVFDELINSELADPLESITNVNDLSEQSDPVFDQFYSDDKPTTDLPDLTSDKNEPVTKELLQDLLQALEEEKKTMSDEETNKYGSTIKNLILAFKQKKLDFRKVCFSF